MHIFLCLFDLGCTNFTHTSLGMNPFTGEPSSSRHQLATGSCEWTFSILLTWDFLVLFGQIFDSISFVSSALGRVTIPFRNNQLYYKATFLVGSDVCDSVGNTLHLGIDFTSLAECTDYEVRITTTHLGPAPFLDSDTASYQVNGTSFY